MNKASDMKNDAVDLHDSLVESSTDFLKRLGTFTLGPIVAAAIGFISVPIITRIVEPSLFGQLSMFTTATTLVGLLILLGFDQAYVRDFACSEDKQKLWYSSLSVPMILSVVFCVISMFFWRPLSRLLFNEELLWPMVGFSLAFPSMTIHRYVTLSIRMNEAGLAHSVLIITTKLVYVIATIALVLSIGAGLGQLVFPIILGYIVAIGVGASLNGVPKLRGSGVDFGSIRSQAVFGLPLVIASAQMYLLNSLDKIALRTWSTFEEMGIYSAAFRLAAVLLLIQQAFTTFWAPTAYRWRENYVGPSRFQTVTDTAALFLTAIFAALMAGRWILVQLLGPQYREAVDLVPLAAIFPLMLTLSETTVMGIGFSRRTHWATVTTTGSLLVNIFGNWLLVPRLGALGAAIATAISLFVYFWSRTIVSNRLWEGVRIRIHVISTVLIIIMCLVGLLFADWRIDISMSLIVMLPIGTSLWKQYGKLKRPKQ